MFDRPGTRSSWYGKVGKKFLSALVLCSLLCSVLPLSVWAQVVPPKVQVTDVVVFLLDEDLASQASIKTRVNRYASDVQAALESQVVIVPVKDSSTPLEIHELLAQYYFSGHNNDGLSQLKGVIMIGDIPLPVVEKGGNYWPTVFPYVDFVKKAYTWDYEQERFVYEDNYLMAPEVWHSVIKSNEIKLTDQVDELEDFFDKNHKTHQQDTDYSKKVFYANFERQKKVIPAESFFRYQEWVKYAEPIQYLRFTKHFARELLENQESAGISAGVFGELEDDEKQKLATDISASNEDVSRADVMESLDTDTLAIMPDIQSKQLIDNFAQRYFEIYTHWITEVNERIGMSARWDPEMIDTTPSLVSRKDEASVLMLRFFNDLAEEALISAFKENNIAENLFINHEVPVVYTEGTGEDSYETWKYKPFYWNGISPKNGFEVENCTLIRGSERAIQTEPLAQQVEANRTLDIRTADSCKHIAEPGYASDIQGGCCAKNLKYEDGKFDYEGCITTSTWLGGQNGEASLYHSGSRKPVLGLAGTREIKGIQGAAGCLPALHFNEAEEHSTRFSTLMLHDEPRPESIMAQVEAQFTRDLPVDDPRGFSFLDHGREFKRLPFPNVFDFRDDVDTFEDFEKAVKENLKATIKRVNDITELGNEASEARVEAESTIYAWPSPPDAPPVPAVQTEGAQMDCRIVNGIEQVDNFMKVRVWTRNCEEYTETTVTSETGGVTTARNSLNTYTDVLKRHYDSGTKIKESVADNFLKNIDLKRIYEALIWIDKNIEEKNREVFEVAMSDTSNFQEFFFDTESDGYEVIEILGEGSHENGLELAFSPLQIKPDREYEDGTDDDNEVGIDVDIKSLCEGIPSRPELDMEYLKAKEKFVEFQFKDGKTKNVFLGKDMAETFLGSEAESECDKIPSTMLYWPSKIACSAKATASGASKKLYLGDNLGTTQPLEPIVESFDVDLKNKRLIIDPVEIMIHAQSVDPVEVRVKVVNAQNQIQIQDFSTEVSLSFDSQEASRLFQIAPDQSIPVTKGEAIFFLIPKTSQFGGKIEMVATASREGSELEVISDPTDILVSRYGAFGVADKTEVVVKDAEGVKIRAQVLNQDNKLTYDLDGSVFEFKTNAGTFLGGETKVEIKEGQATATLLPGTKAGKFEVDLIDPSGKIASSTVKIELLPDVPASIYVSKKSSFLIKAAASIPITAKLLDQYGNVVYDVFHKWSWQWEQLEVEANQERDTDPRIKGIQEFTDYSGESTLLVSAERGTAEGRLTIGSDYFKDGGGRTLKLTVIEDPVFEVKLDQSEVIAGGDVPIKASVKALTKEGQLINDDFDVSLVVTPIEEGFYPDQINFLDGLASFEFTPGTLAGNFQLKLQSPGYVPGNASFKVLPGPPEKIEISRFGNTRYAAELDAGRPIELNIKVLDTYRNVVPTFSGKIDFRATEVTGYLVDIPEASKTISRGQSTIEIIPKGLSGKVRLIADHEDLTGDTLELELADYFRISDVRGLAPKSLMTMIFGFEAGDQRDQENFANAFLHTGNTQSVATLIAPPLPAYQYGHVARNGALGNNLQARLVYGASLDFLLEEEDRILSQLRASFADEPEVFLGVSEKIAPGFYLQGLAEFEDLSLIDSTFYKGQTPLLRVTKKGGITLLDGTTNLEPTDNLFVWALEYQGEILGTFNIFLGGDGLSTVSQFTNNALAGVEMRAIDPDVYYDRVFVSSSTNGDQGIGIFDQTKLEKRDRRLGADFNSVESILNNQDLGWAEEWKAGTVFGALNSIGISHQWGSSDALIIYGDPSLKLRSENKRTSNGLTQDIGDPLWRSSNGVIRKIIGNDINNDGHMDVLNLVENTLYALYQTGENRSHFRDVGPIIQFLDGVISLSALNLGNSDNPNHKDLIQLNSDGKLILWENTNGGVFRSKPLTLALETGIETFQVAKLNTDDFDDLIVTDLNHKVWAVFGKESDFRPPVLIKDLSPDFTALDETFTYGKTDYSPINLKYTMFSYKDIRSNSSIDQLEWNRFVRPTAPVSKTIAPEDLETLLLNDYYNTGGETMTDEAVFVRTDNAPFLSTVTLETDSDKEKIKPGDRIKVKLEVTTKGPLENFALLPAKEGSSIFLEETFRCSGCEGDTRLFPAAGDGFFWAEVGDISGKVTFTWQEEISELNVLKYFVGDFDKGFDDLDDLSLPWVQEDKEVLMEFTTQQKPGNKARVDESPYPLNPAIKTVSKPKLSLDLIQNLSPEDLRKRSAELFGRESDIDNDNLPYSFDHYNSQNNFDLDKYAALQGKNVNFDNLLKANNQEKRAEMLMGGGSCFNQPESAAPSAPGLINDRKVPHAKPKGKQQGEYEMSWLTTKYTPKPIPSTAPADTPGDRTEPHPYKSMGRTYTMPTSTGKTGKAICLGSFPVHMAAPNWTPNCFVSTPPVKFMESCANPEDYEPKKDQLMCSADSYVSGSSAIGTSGASSGRSNAGKKRGPGKINAPLTGTNATSFQNMKSGQMNNDKTGKGQANASSMKPNPDFASKTRPSPTNAGGKKGQNLNNMMADVVNVTHEPVPVSVPASSPQEMEDAKEDFAQNQEELNQETDENIPPIVIDLQSGLDETVKGLEGLQKLDASDLSLPEISAFTPLIKKYRKELVEFRVSLERDVCGKPGKTKTCEGGKKLIREAGSNLQAIERSLNTTYVEVEVEVEAFASGFEALKPEVESFTTELSSYSESLDGPIDARQKVQNHMTRFEQNFKNLDQAAGEGAKKILEIRDLENKIVSSTAQIVEQYQDYHKGWMAKNQQREKEWQAQGEANKQILSMIQTVPQIFTDFANNCRTGNVDRATLLPWLTDSVFEKGASRKVVNLPTTPNAELDGREMSPAKLDLKLPTPQVNQVAMGPIGTMDDKPTVPDYKEDIEEGNETFADKITVAEKITETKSEVAKWNDVFKTLRKTGNFFPKLDREGTVVEKGSTGAILPKINTDFKPVTLENIENLLATDIPELVEEQPFELPFVPTFPAMPGGDDTAFQAEIPSLPMDQLPFLPPPPKMDNLTCGMLNNLKVPLSFLNLECMIRLGVAPVSEWYVKPHVERRTNRSALSKNKDFTSKSIKPGPFTGNPNTMSVFGQTDRNDIFKGNHDKLKETSSSQSQFIKSGSQSPLSKPSNAIPASGKPITTSLINPLEEWKTWVANGEAASERTLDPVTFIKAVKHLSKAMPTYVEAQEDLQVKLATAKVPENTGRAKELAIIDQAFDNYLARLETYRQSRSQETKRLAHIYEKENINFFADKFVQQTINKDKRFLAANSTDSALDFVIPKREFTTSVAEFEPPVADVTDVDFVGEEFVETFDDESSDSCSNLVEPGIYYGDGNADNLDRINKLPYRTISAYAVFDLDDDGVNEILYGLGSELFVKRKSGPNGNKLIFNTQTLEKADLSDYFRPVDAVDRYDYYEALNGEFEKHRTLPKYTEWQFSERPDQIFELHKTAEGQAAQLQKSLGLVQQILPEVSDVRFTTAQVTSVEGAPQIKSPLKIPLVKYDGAACANENIIKPFVESGMVMAIDKPARLQVYFPPHRGREAKVENIMLAQGEEIYLEDADVCLYEGTAWFAQYDYLDEYDFWVTNQEVLASEATDEPKVIKFADGSEILIEGRSEWLEKVQNGVYQNWNPLTPTALLSASQIRLKAGESVRINFSNGEKRTITGPQTYHFQIDEIKNEAHEFKFPVPEFNQVYSQISGYKVNKKSYYKPQFFPIISTTDEE